jgi:hypothetical protein
MTPTTTPASLVEFAEKMVKSGSGEGMLVSGGCDARGRMLNLHKFLPSIGKVHRMGLILKLHTGFADERLARGIAEAGVDIASMEFVGSAESAKEVFGLDASPDDYEDTFAALRDAGVSHIAPHVCVGLHHGELRGEFEALERLRRTIEPSTIALIALRPTRGTKLEGCPPPSAGDMLKVTAHARKLFPETKIILGALRPRGTGAEAGRGARESLELAALRGGVSGAELPSSRMMDEAKADGFRIMRLESFGVLPEQYEGRVRSAWV